MTVRTPRSRPCPNCRRECNAATASDGSEAQPKPGDWTVCWYCAAVLVFDAELCVAWPSPELETPEEVERVRAAIALELERKSPWRPRCRVHVFGFLESTCEICGATRAP